MRHSDGRVIYGSKINIDNLTGDDILLLNGRRHQILSNNFKKMLDKDDNIDYKKSYYDLETLNLDTKRRNKYRMSSGDTISVYNPKTGEGLGGRLTPGIVAGAAALTGLGIYGYKTWKKTKKQMEELEEQKKKLEEAKGIARNRTALTSNSPYTAHRLPTNVGYIGLAPSTIAQQHVIPRPAPATTATIANTHVNNMRSTLGLANIGSVSGIGNKGAIGSSVSSFSEEGDPYLPYFNFSDDTDIKPVKKISVSGIDALSPGDIIMSRGNIVGIQGIRKSLLGDNTIDIVDSHGNNKIIKEGEIPTITIIRSKSKTSGTKILNEDSLDKLPDDIPVDIDLRDDNEVDPILDHLSLNKHRIMDSLAKICEDHDCDSDECCEEHKPAGKLVKIAVIIKNIDDNMAKNAIQRSGMSAYRVNTV